MRCFVEERSGAWRVMMSDFFRMVSRLVYLK